MDLSQLLSDIDRFEVLRWVVLLGVCAIACITDIRTMKIPNWLTFPMVLTGLVALGLTGGWGIDGLLGSVLAMCIMAWPYMVVYALGGGGAGDVKLLAGIGAWSGIDLGIYLLSGVAICGLIYSLVGSVKRRGWKMLSYAVMSDMLSMANRAKGGSSSNSQTTTTDDDGESEETLLESDGMPYAPPIAVGVVLGGLVWQLQLV